MLQFPLLVDYCTPFFGPVLSMAAGGIASTPLHRPLPPLACRQSPQDRQPSEALQPQLALVIRRRVQAEHGLPLVAVLLPAFRSPHAAALIDGQLPAAEEIKTEG